MRHQDIRVGDTLKLRKDNPYGLPPLRVFVTELRYRPGYKVPHVISGPDAYRPKDFSGREVQRIRTRAEYRCRMPVVRCPIR